MRLFVLSLFDLVVPMGFLIQGVFRINKLIPSNKPKLDKCSKRILLNSVLLEIGS